MQISPLNEHDFDHVQDLGMALLQKLRDLDLAPHLVVVTSPAFEPQGLSSAVAQRVLDAARMLAAAPGIAWVIAGHAGPAPNAKPEVAEAALWRCTAGLSLAVTLTGPKGETITLKGWQIGRGALAFEDLETEPLS
jgi:hypothetical protein